jgi:tRNA A-37 threonylcarbamoyl transferase component Bud32
MSAPNSVEELVQLISKSGMVDEQKLAAYLQRRQFTRGLPSDVRAFADDMIRDGVLTYFQAEQFLLGKWRGFTIGKYKLLERIGVGGMGQVFLCEHMFMRRRVAVKVLPPAKADQPAALGRFYREARAAGSLDHPNVVRTQDVDQDGNLHFIVMDYVDGPNLMEVVKKIGPLDVGRAVSYVRQSALGLDYAFRNGIIHRDIKPGNVLIDRRGTARILDMGLAKFYKDVSDLLTLKYDDKIVLGTADYVAPEQIANSHAVDVRADVYALGATFYFLLAGHPPFPTGTVSQKLLWHRTKEPTPIRQIRQDVPEELAAVVARMMAKDPKARYQTPAQVAAELDRWMPEVVQLPGAEEMPQLSPAATDGANTEGTAEVLIDPVVAGAATTTPVVAVASPLAPPRSGVGTIPVREPARPAPSPFGPVPGVVGSPWGATTAPAKAPSGDRPGLAPRPPLGALDTAGAAERTPGGPQPAAFVGSNPFPGGDLVPGPTARKKVPWAVIAAVGIAVIAGGVLVVLKVIG